MAKIVKGRDVLLAIWDETNEDYFPVACITSHTYSVSVEEETEEPTKCDPDPAPEVSSISYEITGDGQMLDSSDENFSDRTTGSDLEKIIWEGDSVDWRITGGNEDKYGTGLLTSYDEAAPADGKMTFSFTLTGNQKPTSTDTHDSEE